MLGTGFSLTGPALRERHWSPAILLTPAETGVWLGGFNPAAGRLFQDAGASLPATLPGQPVGQVQRMAGAVNVSQSTGAARPVLGRHPRSGRRNLAHGSSVFTLAGGWPELASSQNGLTSSRVAQGLENGTPFVDIRWSGTASGTSHALAYSPEPSRLAAVSGDGFTASITARLLAGSLTAASGLTVQIAGETASGSWLEGGNAPLLSSASESRSAISYSLSNAATLQARCGLALITTPGAVVDATFRIKGLQFERGLAATAVQHSFSAFDLTEPGGIDVWYLGFDGSDDLLASPSLSWGSAQVTAVVALAKLGAEGSPRQVLSQGSSSGGWMIYAPGTTGRYSAGSSGGSLQLAITANAALATPHQAVIAMRGSIAPALVELRVNGAAVASSSTGQGAASSYPASALQLGGGGGNAPFQGRIYDMFVLNRQLSAADTLRLEQHFIAKYGIGLG